MYPPYYTMLSPPAYSLCSQGTVPTNFLPLPYPFYYPLHFNSPTQPFYSALPLP